LVARIDSRGNNVAKRLVGVIAHDAEAMLPAGEPVLVGGAEVGAVTSAAGSVGLAYLKRSVDSLPVEATVGDTPVVLENVPLVSR
jgi:folate-binding Fe-S cluster repair protein YgfZ